MTVTVSTIHTLESLVADAARDLQGASGSLRCGDELVSQKASEIIGQLRAGAKEEDPASREALDQLVIYATQEGYGGCAGFQQYLEELIVATIEALNDGQPPTEPPSYPEQVDTTVVFISPPAS